MADEGRGDKGAKKTHEKPSPYTMTKEGVNELPMRAFPGKIRVLTRHSHHDRIGRAVGKLRRSRVLGFDTETRPSYKKGESHPIALIQLSTRHDALLFRISGDGHGEKLPAGLRGILESPRILKIGQGLKHELRTMKKELGVEGRGFVDLLDIAHRLDTTPKSVRGLCALFLGFRITKSSQTTNWARQKLTEKQKVYAATDAWACLLVYEQLRRRGVLKGSWGRAHK
jgi:ribonuclease D